MFHGTNRLTWTLGLTVVWAAAWAVPGPLAAATADHLLLSEVVVQVRPPAATFGSKFIEIVNPTDESIDLSHVYLTDATNTPNIYYYNIVNYAAAGGGTGGDFHARFPSGAMLAAGDTLVVAIKGSQEYQQAYGRLPDFELYEDGLAPDTVPELVEAFPGSINAGLGSSGANSPDLNATAETVVMYEWNGNTDLVQDLDYIIWGSVTSVRTDKTGVSIDGPDAGQEPTSYQPDTAVGLQRPIAAAAHPFGGSYRRISADEGSERSSGGNGLTLHDETSEPLDQTWQVMTTQDPPAPPAVLFPAAPILLDVGMAPAIPYEGTATVVTAEIVSHDPVTAVSLFYQLDGSRFVEVPATDNGGGTWSAEIPTQPRGVVVGWYLQVSGGGTAYHPVTAPTRPSVYTVVGSPPPVFGNVSLSPPAPYAAVSTLVTANLSSILPVVGFSLFYAIDGGDFTEVACQDNGDGSWSGEIPILPVGTMVSWYLEAEASGGGSATYPTEAPGVTEGFTVLQSAPPVDAPVHLLFSEVCTKGTDGEFVEIYNPTRQPVDLTNYYLTDATYRPGNQLYWRIVLPGAGSAEAGGGTYGDFHARFPAGAILPAYGVLTVGIAPGGGYRNTYGEPPTYELFDSSAAIPDMLPAFPGALVEITPPSSTPTGLTNAGESVVLYYWNGRTDLVTDIDVFIWGTSDSYRFSKTGVQIDGPDQDTTTSPYRPETAYDLQHPFVAEHDFGESYQRLGPGEDDEIRTGSNGVGGNDEVSEDLEVSWTMAPVTAGYVNFAGGTEEGTITLKVPGRTFLPLDGEVFPISFTSKRNHTTIVRIFDLEGRLVLTLFNSDFDGAAGTDPDIRPTTRTWDGRDEDFELVPAGLYVVHLSVLNPLNGDQETKTAPVVVATRLSH